MAKLQEQAIRAALKELPGWELTAEGLRKKFEFAGFPEAVQFVNKLVEPAEAAQHHPNIAVVYRWVTLILTTHDEGGVTQKDIDLARTIERLGSAR
jgi:4a-hydroxytetrahydrobiopterin dehydratase